jgi:hypothetical protein
MAQQAFFPGFRHPVHAVQTSRRHPSPYSAADRSKVEVQISRYERVIGDTLRSCGHPQRKTEARIAVKALNRMNEPGRPISVRVA